MLKPEKTFTLTKTHINLITQLNINQNQDHFYNIPVLPMIDEKRPFGNSYILGDVFEVMGLTPDENEDYTEAQKQEAYQALIELPQAMRIILHYQTFTPGTYDVPSSQQIKQKIEYNFANTYKIIQELTSGMTDDFLANLLKSISRCTVSDNPVKELQTCLEDYLYFAKKKKQKTAAKEALAKLNEIRHRK